MRKEFPGRELLGGQLPGEECPRRQLTAIRKGLPGKELLGRQLTAIYKELPGRQLTAMRKGLPLMLVSCEEKKALQL
jgi:hypothetical protein